MKIKRQGLEVFTLSFLDIISCAFGAVVMLILIAKPDENEGGQQPVAAITQLIQALYTSENNTNKLQQQQQQNQQQQQRNQTQLAQLQQQQQQLSTQLQQAQQQLQQLAQTEKELTITAIPKPQKPQQQTLALQANTATERDEEVGGIPVDSDYIIFIVDTSGSMQRVWSRVIKEMDNILNNHPKVKGFQIMNDMGEYLISGYKRRWIKDTPTIRQQALNLLRVWRGYSNSSPVEGLTVALKTYAKKYNSLSIYILGDEYSGGSYDPVIKTLNQLNTNPKTGKRIARVHGIGFNSGQSLKKFSTLMRAVAQQNRGTFLALP